MLKVLNHPATGELFSLFNTETNTSTPFDVKNPLFIEIVDMVKSGTPLFDNDEFEMSRERVQKLFRQPTNI